MPIVGGARFDLLRKMPIVGGARFENSRDMQMPRYRSYRDTVGTEYIEIDR